MREVEVLRAAADGLSCPQSAALMGLSPSTVKSHRRNVLAKLGAPSMTAAVARAKTAGLLERGADDRLRVVRGKPRRPAAPEGFVAVPLGAVEALEACARAVLAGHARSAVRFAGEGLAALPAGGGEAP